MIERSEGHVPQHKLVGDRMPHIMAARGLNPLTHTLQPEAHARELQRRLQDELAEDGQLGGSALGMER
jgi:predicted house-cleaning noncanonical NTP pyrophosphatase (MazG superfamily)